MCRDYGPSWRTVVHSNLVRSVKQILEILESHGDASDENAAEDRLWCGWQPSPHIPQTAGDMIMCRCGRRVVSRHPFVLSRRLGLATVCGCGWCTVGFSNHPVEFLGGVPTFRQVWTSSALSLRPLLQPAYTLNWRVDGHFSTRPH